MADFAHLVFTIDNLCLDVSRVEISLVQALNHLNNAANRVADVRDPLRIEDVVEYVSGDLRERDNIDVEITSARSEIRRVLGVWNPEYIRTAQELKRKMSN